MNGNKLDISTKLYEIVVAKIKEFKTSIWFLLRWINNHINSPGFKNWMSWLHKIIDEAVFVKIENIFVTTINQCTTFFVDLFGTMIFKES